MAISELDPSGPLDIGALTELANRMFKAWPGTVAGPALQAQPGVAATPAPGPAGLATPADGNVPPATPLPLPAIGGIGRSPGAAPVPAPTSAAGTVAAPSDPVVPAPPPLGIPSVGGAGISPSGAAPSPTAAPLAFDPAGARPLVAVEAVGALFPNVPAAGVPPVRGTLPPGTDATQPDYYFLQHAPKQARGIQVPGWPHDPEPAKTARPGFDPHLYRRDFPILDERVNGRRLVWLDNAATTQKPNAVVERLRHFYRHENSNIHRAAHELAARSTDAYEAARESVRRFLNARSPEDIVFVRGATEAINLVAQSWGRQNIGKDDEIVISWLEHHANIVPWQQLCAETGARLRVVPVDDCGQIRLDQYAEMLGPKTRLVSFTQVSNALGTVTPAHEMVALAHGVGARVLVDGAQAVSHMPVDVQGLGADWYVFSGHKVFAPTGIGALYGRKELLDATQPWQGGGNMIRDVTFEHTEYQAAPARFEAGTGNIADAVGLGAALDYVMKIGMPAIGAYEHSLLEYGTRVLESIPGLRLIGTAAEKAGVLSFVLAGHRTEDIGAALNREGIAVRSGHHCAQPILRRFGLEATVRPSLAFYNTFDELDCLAAAVRRIASGRSPV